MMAKRKRITVTLHGCGCIIWNSTFGFGFGSICLHRMEWDGLKWYGMECAWEGGWSCYCCWRFWCLLYSVETFVRLERKKKQQSFEMIKRLYFMWYQALTTWRLLSLPIFVAAAVLGVVATFGRAVAIPNSLANANENEFRGWPQPQQLPSMKINGAQTHAKNVALRALLVNLYNKVFNKQHVFTGKKGYISTQLIKMDATDFFYRFFSSASYKYSIDVCICECLRE